jgi:hypothetical protein
MTEGDWIVVFLAMNAVVLSALWIVIRKKDE